MRYAAAAVGVVLSLSFIAGCAKQDQQPPAAAAKPDEATIRAALEPRLAKIGEMFSKKDAAGVAGLFTDDAVWILPDASTFKGKDAIQAGATTFFTSFDSTSAATETIDKVIVVSDTEVVTFATGKFTIYMKGKKTGEAHSNPFADQWKKGADGVWRIAYEVNADGPVTPPAPATAPAAKKKS